MRGAEPIAFVDYIAVPRPDPEVHAAIGRSLSEACRRAKVTLAGERLRVCLVS